MSDEERQKTVTLRLAWTDYAPKKLSARIQEFKQRNGRVELDDRVAAIQFLRGTTSRASHVLPALYLALGARSLPEDCSTPHWQVVQAAALEQSALHTIALACRAIFDDGKNRLSGKRSRGSAMRRTHADATSAIPSAAPKSLIGLGETDA